MVGVNMAAGAPLGCRATTRHGSRPFRLAILATTAAILAATATPTLAATRPQAQPRLDLTATALPAEQPAQAASRITCLMESYHGCLYVTQVLLSLPFAWHHAGYQVVIAGDGSSPCGRASSVLTASGCALARERQVWLKTPWADRLTEEELEGGFPDQAARSVALSRTMAHEMGHVMHQSCPGERRTLERYRQARAIPSSAARRGHGPIGTPAFSSVAEDFAEAAAMHLLPGGMPSRSRLVPVPTAAELQVLAAEFFHVCTDHEPDDRPEQVTFTTLRQTVPADLSGYPSGQRAR